MSTSIHEALDQMELTILAERSAQELQRLRRNEPYDERYPLALVHRAIVEQADEAWSLLYQCFSEFIHKWIASHRSKDIALLRDSEENYVAQTFSRFWFALRDKHVEFSSVAAVLSYLRATLEGVLTDTVRSQALSRSREVSLSGPECYREPCVEEDHDDQHIWVLLQALIQDEREKRLVYLLYYCGLKPREIARRCSQEFADVKDIYRLNHNIMERLRRNGNRVYYLLGQASHPQERVPGSISRKGVNKARYSRKQECSA